MTETQPDPALAIQRTAPGDGATAASLPAYVWLFLAGLVFNLFSGTSGELLHLPLSLDRPFFLLAIVLLALDHRRPRMRWRAIHLFMALLVAWVLWSWASTGSIFDFDKAFALSDRIVVPFAMFVVGPLIFNDLRARTLLLRTLTVIGLYLAVTGIAEVVGPHQLVFPPGIADKTLGIQYGRARGPFLSSEPLGMSVVLCGVAAGVLAFEAALRWRVAAIVCVVGCAFVGVLSLTRSVWVAEALIVVLCVAAVPALRRRAGRLILGLVAVTLLTIAALPQLTSSITSRADTSRSVYDRFLTNDAALRILDSHPFFGVGWGRFIEVSSVWVRQAPTYPLTNTNISVHNVFLSLAAETGLIGAVLWGVAALSGPLTVVATRGGGTVESRVWRLFAMCAVLVWIFPTLLSPNPYPFPNNLVWLIAGVASYFAWYEPAQLQRPATPLRPGSDSASFGPSQHEGA